MNEFQPIIEFVKANSEIFIAIGAVLVVYWLVKKWPDIATFTFLRSGIRGGKNVEVYRQDLAENVSDLGNQIQKASAEQKLKIQAVNLERKRLNHLVKSHPQLVKEVGKSLIKIEKEYQKSLKEVKSSQAQEVLRLTTEKRLNDLLKTLEINSEEIPSFEIDDES